MNVLNTAQLSVRNLLASTLIGALLVAVPLLSGPANAEVAPAKNSVTASIGQSVNINTASVDSLASLHGIGVAKAQAIVEYRKKFGDFRSKEDLLAVEGIGRATLSKNSNRIAL